MACAISISSSPEDIWMISNRGFCAFAAEVVARSSKDEEIIAQIELAEVMNGVSLDLLHDENPEISLRLLKAFKDVASDIAQGKLSIPTEVRDLAEMRTIFSNLIKLLDKYEITLIDLDERKE